MSSSPWSDTNIVKGQYLDILRIRTIPAEPDDVKYVIESQYHLRPDLLAYDMYGDTKLWWVFAQRNMDSLKDPVYDFKSGLEIFVPKGSKLRSKLGV